MLSAGIGFCFLFFIFLDLRCKKFEGGLVGDKAPYCAIEKLGLFYVRFMDDILDLAPTLWKLRKAVKRSTGSLRPSQTGGTRA